MIKAGGGGGDLFEPIAYLIGKLISKFGQEIFRTIFTVPFEDWSAREWWYIFFLVMFPTTIIMVLIYFKKKSYKKRSNIKN
jgi:hypothetical protein